MVILSDMSCTSTIPTFPNSNRSTYAIVSDTAEIMSFLGRLLLTRSTENPSKPSSVRCVCNASCIAIPVVFRCGPWTRRWRSLPAPSPTGRWWIRASGRRAASPVSRTPDSWTRRVRRGVRTSRRCCLQRKHALYLYPASASVLSVGLWMRMYGNQNGRW